MKTFCRQRLQASCRAPCNSPVVVDYSAEKVAGLSDEELTSIAGETLARSAQRKQWQELRQNLDLALKELGRTVVV